MSKNELRGSGKQRSCAFANGAMYTAVAVHSCVSANGAMNCNVLCVDELMPAAAKG